MNNSLKELLFFSCLSPEQMDKIMSYIEPLELKTGEILFEEGEEGNYVSFVISGSLNVLKMTNWQNLTNVIATLNEGSCIGGISLIDQTPRSAKVIANENTTLAILTQKAFDTMVKHEPELAVNVLKGVVQTLSENLQPKINRAIEKEAA